MQDYTEQTFAFTPVRGCRVEAVFDEPAVTSDGGAVLLREILERSQLLADIAHALGDDRRPGSVRHPALKVLRQRVAQIACGYFRADDGDALRDDPVRPPWPARLQVFHGPHPALLLRTRGV